MNDCNKWTCDLCGACITSAFPRNLNLLVNEHVDALCPYKDRPADQRPLNARDAKFLEELKVAW
jgi:hypothetical protein